MHDARPHLAADAAQVVHVVEQGVHERAARVARGRVHDHAGGLVDDDHVVILVQDREGQRLRLRLGIDRRGYLDGDLPSGLDRLVRFGVAAVDGGPGPP